MPRAFVCAVVLVASMSTVHSVVAGAAVSSSEPAGSQVSATAAAPFLGEWVMAMQAQTGPAKYDLIVKLEKDVVVGDITGPAGKTQRITDITKPGDSLLLRYGLNFAGKDITSVVTLTPGGGRHDGRQDRFRRGASTC